jgi:hypothetical protein
MSEIVERVAQALCSESGDSWVSSLSDEHTARRQKQYTELARAALAAIPQDEDIKAFLYWVDFKQSGKPDQEWNGARKLLEAFGLKP